MAELRSASTRPTAGGFTAAVGLEIHAQLATSTKLFCPCRAAFSAPPNDLTCPVCRGWPGTLPVLNTRAVELAVRVALALDCEIAARSTFARKHYFYQDLPRNYQITQGEEPLAQGGSLPVSAEAALTSVALQRLHLEEDAGRSRHDATSGQTLVDLNRAGVPLVEIVTQPVLGSGAEVRACVQSLRRILIYLEACGGNLERGEMRCDANVSVRPPGQHELGTRVELKNLNSLRALQRAVDFEIERQTALLRAGDQVRAETRAWDPAKRQTYLLRRKEEEPDYRYLPEPDLPPLRIGAALLAEQRVALPELPLALARRLNRQYGLGEGVARQLASGPALVAYFEAVVAVLLEVAASDEPTESARLAANWLLGAVGAWLKGHARGIDEFPVAPDRLGRLLLQVQQRCISGTQAKEVLAAMIDTGAAPEALIAAGGVRVIADGAALEAAVRRVLAVHREEVAAWRQGKKNLLQFFVGQVMRATGGQADPARTAKIVAAELARVPEEGS